MRSWTGIMQRIRETLRTALNDAIREKLITSNAAKWVQLPAASRPKPVIWTPERVEHWRRTGQVPSPVMVWTAEQTGAFLDHAPMLGSTRCSTWSPTADCAVVRQRIGRDRRIGRGNRHRAHRAPRTAAGRPVGRRAGKRDRPLPVEVTKIQHRARPIGGIDRSRLLIFFPEDTI
jgi:hypothetical protein